MRKTPKTLEDSTPVPATLAEQSDDGQPVLRKYAGAVHIGADLTLYQRRAFNVLLFWAMPEMPRTTRHEIDLDELAWGMGLERASQRMERLIESLDKMMEARVVWNLLDDKGDLEEWESATLLPYVKVSKKTRTVLYEFTSAFQERVYNPSEFAEIALRMQRVFRSEHALALYENTRRFLINGETPWIPLDTFRSLMGVGGKPYYDEFKYLSARLIKPAMRQVNECSDIQLQLKTKRQNRTVVEIKYIVSDNAKMTLFAESLTQEPTQISTEDERRLLLRLSGYRITGKRAEFLLHNHTEEHIILALDAADAWMEIKEAGREPIVNPAGVAYKAITEGWRLPSNGKDSANTGGSTQEDVHQTKLIHESSERQAAIESEFRKKWYVEFIERTPEPELNLLKLAFEEALVASPSDRLILEKYRKQGLTGIARGLFQHFLAARGIRPTDEEIKAYTESMPTRGTQP
ncbi:replication initiation protein [uncultured Thiodictyon sp.]|uniref:replication initiation protein n=1 Tax=uncultured Thiodictyon sp. TaxID=1846217 RepID=UPI0025E5EDEC|nr:replication initiation protein [uncultured Thiodictyon sp.]